MDKLRSIISQLSVVIGLVCIFSLSPLEAAPNDSGAKGPKQDISLYYTIRPDYRRCISPLCGGYWISAVNKPLTRCADKTLANECYVTEIDWDHIGLDGSEGASLVLGGLVKKRYKGFSRLGALVPKDAWRAASLSSSMGDWYGVSDNGIRCITFPCYSYNERKLNGTSIKNISGIDLSGVSASQQDLDAAWDALTKDELIAVGANVIIPDEGPAGDGLTLKVSNFYLRVSASKNDPLFCNTVDDCTSTVYHSFVADESECYCTLCPAPMSAETARINQYSYQTHCSSFGSYDGTLTGGLICPQVLCMQPPPLGCVNNQCVYIDDGSGIFDTMLR